MYIISPAVENAFQLHLCKMHFELPNTMNQFSLCLNLVSVFTWGPRNTEHRAKACNLEICFLCCFDVNMSMNFDIRRRN